MIVTINANSGHFSKTTQASRLAVGTIFIFLWMVGLPSVCCGADEISVRHVVVPGYPRPARMARIEGSVTLEIVVGPKGEVSSVKVSGGHRLLQQAAAENILLWIFRPSPVGGSLASNHLIVTYVYRLEGNEVYYDPPPKVVLDLPTQVVITSQPPEPQP